MNQPYGIYVNPYTGYIYGTDAGSFEGAGYLYLWTPEGQLINKYKVYINPGHFLALPPDGHFDNVEIIKHTMFGNGHSVYDFSGRPITDTERSNGKLPMGGYIIDGKKIIFRQ